MFAIAIASAVEAQKSESNKKRASIAQAQVSTLIALACTLTEKQNSQSSMICVSVLLKCNSDPTKQIDELKKKSTYWPSFFYFKSTHYINKIGEFVFLFNFHN